MEKDFYNAVSCSLNVILENVLAVKVRYVGDKRKFFNK